MITKQVKIISVVVVVVLVMILMWLYWPSRPLGNGPEKTPYATKSSPSVRGFEASTQSIATSASTTMVSALVLQSDDAVAVSELGVVSGTSIKNGFVFYKGRYVPPPYIVSRRGATVYINDMCIKRQNWPPPDMTVTEDPGDPAMVPQDSTILDITAKGGQNNHIARKERYLYQHYPAPQAFKLMLEFYKRLPCVKSIESSGTDTSSELVKINFKNGQQLYMQIGPPAGTRIVGMQDKKTQIKESINDLESTRMGIEQFLRDGYTCIAIGGKKYETISKVQIARKLRTIADICQSSKTEEEKIGLLWRLELLPANEKEGLKEFILNFRNSAEYQQRVAEEERAEKVTPLRISDIPKEHPDELLEKQFQRSVNASKPGTMPSLAE